MAVGGKGSAILDRTHQVCSGPWRQDRIGDASGFVVYSPRHSLGCVNSGSNLGATWIQVIFSGRELTLSGCACFRTGDLSRARKGHENLLGKCEPHGTLDTKPYGDEERRSWLFRTVGYGHGSDFWSDFISTLEIVGYDHVLSIEHEDSLISVENGLAKATSFLSQWVIKEKLKTIWWT